MEDTFHKIINFKEKELKLNLFYSKSTDSPMTEIAIQKK
jgi:hypothetical protein